MEPTTAISDDLPVLYRAILDLVEELERCEGRAEAGRIRTEALSLYAGGWNGVRRRRLQHLHGRLRRSIDDRRRPPRRWFQLP